MNFLSDFYELEVILSVFERDFDFFLKIKWFWMFVLILIYEDILCFRSNERVIMVFYFYCFIFWRKF